jgi:DNA-binding NtrC family response regulator
MAAAAASPFVGTCRRILVASADSNFRRQLIASSAYAQRLSEEAASGAHALAKLSQVACDNVLLDRNLPDLDPTEVAETIRQRFPQIEVEFVDSKEGGNVAHESAQETEPQRESDSTGSVFLATAIHDAKSQRKADENELVETLPGMLGSGPAMQRVTRLARMVAPRDTTVLITGETGTGKELVAQAIHKLSSRAAHPFVVVNCAAIPETLFEAELFGYSRGAFTGAVQSRLGRVHVAQGGTLFLDEVGELPLSMQAKLLRFLQNGEVQRLGSSEVFRVDVRVVCATNTHLLNHIQTKQFRQDLYYRLAVFPILMPALRERLEDVGVLSAHFLAQLSGGNALPGKYLTPSALTLLQRLRWEGNVRELQHAIERAFILSGNESALCVEHFRSFGEGGQLREI